MVYGSNLRKLDVLPPPERIPLLPSLVGNRGSPSPQIRLSSYVDFQRAADRLGLHLDRSTSPSLRSPSHSLSPSIAQLKNVVQLLEEETARCVGRVGAFERLLVDYSYTKMHARAPRFQPDLTDPLLLLSLCFRPCPPTRSSLPSAPTTLDRSSVRREFLYPHRIP